MKTKKQAQGEARRLFRLSLVNGSLDSGRVRRIVQRLLDARRPGTLSVLTLFQRLVRLDRAAHSARVESATPLPPAMRASIEADLARIYGSGTDASYTANPTLLGGVRITVGSDVYDGSVHGRLAALEEQF